MARTLIIFDWDDTLFPTTWLMKNGIDLTNKTTQQKYIVLFSNLDILLFNLFSKLVTKSQIIIITNATKKWVEISSVMLPKTQNIIKQHIPVLSARDLYKNQYPNDIMEWKKHTFKNLSHFKNNNFKNIISIGDAEYEFLATINLYDKQARMKHKLLKTVRLFPEPSFESLLKQLNLLASSIDRIITCDRHLDLKFANA